MHQNTRTSGVGRGFGLLTARTILRDGWTVDGGVRDPDGRDAQKRDTLLAAARDAGGELAIVELDVLSKPSAAAAAAVMRGAPASSNLPGEQQ